MALGQVPALRQVRYVDLPYFIGLASMTIYIGAHRGLCTKVRQQISIKEVWLVESLSMPHLETFAHLAGSWQGLQLQASYTYSAPGKLTFCALHMLFGLYVMHSS